MVGGQEDMIVDVALDILQQREHRVKKVRVDSLLAVGAHPLFISISAGALTATTRASPPVTDEGIRAWTSGDERPWSRDQGLSSALPGA